MSERQVPSSLNGSISHQYVSSRNSVPLKRSYTIDDVPAVWNPSRMKSRTSVQNRFRESNGAQTSRTNLAAIVADELGAVALDDERELCGSKRAVLQPLRKLAVPNAVVPAQLFARLLHEVRDDVPVCEVEHAGLGFGVELAECRSA